MRLFSKLSILTAMAAGLFLAVGQASAEFKENYSAPAFDAAQNDNKHIVVEVFKRGCGTCKAQQPSLEAARAQYPNAVFFKFDFKNNTAAVERFKVIKQSTIIVFKGDKEVARSVGETDRTKILEGIGLGA